MLVSQIPLSIWECNLYFAGNLERNIVSISRNEERSLCEPAYISGNLCIVRCAVEGTIPFGIGGNFESIIRR